LVSAADREGDGWGRKAPAKPAIAVIADADGSEPADSSKPANEVITDFWPTIAPPYPVGKSSASASEAYRELIGLELECGRNAMGIWQDLVDRHGFAGGYQSVQRFDLPPNSARGVVVI
jgi:hypothetical protein